MIRALGGRHVRRLHRAEHPSRQSGGANNAPLKPGTSCECEEIGYSAHAPLPSHSVPSSTSLWPIACSFSAVRIANSAAPLPSPTTSTKRGAEQSLPRGLDPAPARAGGQCQRLIGQPFTEIRVALPR